MHRVIFVLNGPNLNMLGVREREYYGSGTLDDLRAFLRSEGQVDGLRNRLSPIQLRGRRRRSVPRSTARKAAGIVINPAALSFTSPSLVEALRAFPGPKIEVHITNVHARDSIYHNSQVSKVVTAVIAGLGFDGYEYALEAVRRRLDDRHAKR